MTSPEMIRLKPFPFPSCFAIVFAIVFYIISLAITHNRSTLVVAIVMSIISVFIWLFIRKIEIKINDKELIYKNILTTKRIYWREVLKSYVKFYRRGKASAYFWHFETVDQRIIKFSVRFFTRKSLRILAQEVISKSKGAKVDECISNMNEGIFPWRIFW